MSQPIATMLWALAIVVGLGSTSLLVVRHDLATHRAARRSARPAPRAEDRRVST